MRIFARLAHEHHILQHHLGGEVRYGERDRPEPADLMLRRHRAFLPRMRFALAAVVDERQPLAFRILEIEREAAVALPDFADLHAGLGRRFFHHSKLSARRCAAPCGDECVPGCSARRGNQRR